MSTQSASQIKETLSALKAKRKSGELDVQGFYKELLVVLRDLVDSLINEEGGTQTMDITDVRSQIPLILGFLDDQAAAFGERQ